MKITRFQVVAFIYIALYFVSVGLAYWMNLDVREAFGVPSSQPLNYEFILTQGLYFIFIAILVFLYDHYKEKYKILSKHQKFFFIISIVPLILILTSMVITFAVFQPMTSTNEGTSQSQSSWRASLNIVLFGEKYEIPSNIGINNGVKSKVYTLNSDGIIYKNISGNVTLKDFFAIWNKNFNSTCILDYCNNNDNSMRMYVNSKENFDYENYIIKDGDIIIIDYR